RSTHSVELHVVTILTLLTAQDGHLDLHSFPTRRSSDLLVPSSLSKEDVSRSAIALDFYQGFQFGLDELAQKGRSFSLHVVKKSRSEEHTSELQSREKLVCRLLLEKKKFENERY